MIRSTALVFASVVVLSGFAAANASESTARHAVAQRDRGWMSRDANPKHAWLYVSGYDNDVINIYDLNRFGTPHLGSITQGVTNPGGITLDSQGTLYVPNTTAQTVTVYPAGATTPTLTLSTPGRAQGAAVDSVGNVYVCVRGSNPGIAVYPPRQTTMSQFITSSLIQNPNQLVFDSAGTLYIVDDNAGVSVLPPGPSENVTSLNLNGLLPGSTSGIALNPLSGGFYISFSKAQYHLLEYAAGQQDPERKRRIHSGSADFMTSGLLHRSVRVFVPDGGSNVVYIFKSTLRGTPAEITTASQSVQGLAFKPPGMP
jgi:hypothetical protein